MGLTVDVETPKTPPSAPGSGVKGAVGGQNNSDKSETDINIKLHADDGTSATGENVNKNKGSAAVSVASEAYVGAY